jgi:zinc protease
MKKTKKSGGPARKTKKSGRPAKTKNKGSTSKTTTNNVIKKVLPNGLTVLLKEDHSNPVVAINVWFGVGSVNETEEQGGLAHFQEHMVFKGTERHGVGDIAKIIKSAGGNLNAGTSYSYTMYYVVLPSKAFSLGLDIQADAMMNSTFDPEEFKKERLVVMEEARMYDDTPDSYMFYRTMELGYEVHNYRRPIAGRTEVVEKFTRDQLLDFYKTYYRPANAVLVVVGDVKPDAAFAEIEKVYGHWKNGSVDVNESPTEPPQKALRFTAMRGTIDHGYLGLGFHVPSILDKDYPALEMLSTLLGTGRSSRLYRRVVEDKHLATTISASLLAEKWPGFFMVFASTPNDKWDEAFDVIVTELGRFQREPVAEEELLKARRQIEKSMYGDLETVEGQASNLGYYELLGDYALAEQHREAIRRVTPEQLMTVARKYFAPQNSSVVSYLPKGDAIEEPTREEVEARLAEKFAEPAEPVIAASTTPGQKTKESSAKARPGTSEKPVVKRLTLDNGLTVLVKNRRTVPMVSMMTVFRGGARLEPRGKSGLSMLTNRTLLKGTKSYTGDDVVGMIEGLGGRIETLSSFDVTGTYISILSEYLDDAIPVYEEVLRAPELSRDKVEKEKTRLLKELAKRHDHPVYMSIDALFANVFGDHPYAHPFIGDESQLAMLTDRDCREWYERVLTPKNMVMVFVGDITESHAMDIAQQLAGDLPEKPIPEPDREAPAAAVGPGLHQLKRKDLKQAVGLVGFIAPPMMTPEAISLGVLDGIMTGLGGRLFHELRDKRSLGYMAGSALAALKERSLYYGYSNPNPGGLDEAIEVITSELERVAREKVSDEELSRSKGWLTGSQLMKMQRNTSQAVEYGVYEALGFGYDVVDRTAEIIQGVTAEHILAAASKVFHRDRAVMVKLVPEVEEARTAD